MNKKLLIGLTLVSLLASRESFGQTFGSGISITGITNAQLFSGSTYVTNVVSFTMPSKQIVLSGISNTNETFIGAMYMQVPGITNVGTLSNVVLLGAVTNSFSGGTNSGTWTTNTPSSFTTYYLPVYMSANVGTNTNTIYVP